MAAASQVGLLIVFGIVVLLSIGAAVGLVFLIRYFIRYNARMKREKTPEQRELDKTRIDDL